MDRHATEGGHLVRLLRGAAVLCRRAEPISSRPGPGRPRAFAAWQVGMLILVAIVHRRKSKSAQYRFLDRHRDKLLYRPPLSAA